MALSTTGKCCLGVSWLRALRLGYQPPNVGGMSPSERVACINAATEAHIRTSPQVRTFLESIPTGPDTCCPDSSLDDIIETLASRRGDVDKSDTSVWADFVEYLLFPRFRFTDAEMARAWPVAEYPYLSVLQELSAAMNRLYIAWFRRMVIPYRALTPDQQAAFRAKWEGRLPEYDHTVYDHDLQDVNARQTLSQAFPNEVTLLVRCLNWVISETTDAATIEYWQSLIDAYAETNLAKVEERWRNVDLAWIRLPATASLVPIHSLETYEHPFGVSPEYRIMQRVTSDDEAQVIADFRRGTEKRMSEQGLPPATLDAARQKLNRLDIGIFQPVVSGGVGTVKRIAGKVGPNRQEVLAQGGKVFIMGTAEVNGIVDVCIKSLHRHCSEATAAMLAPLLTAPILMLSTIGHECFHPVARTAENEKALGTAVKHLEEAKATAGGILVALDLYPTVEARRLIVAKVLARALLFMQRSRLADASAAEYVRENLVLIETMVRAGILKLEDDGLSVHIDEFSLFLWESLLMDFVTAVIYAYKTDDVALLAERRTHFCGADDRGASDEVRAIIAWVNR